MNDGRVVVASAHDSHWPHANGNFNGIAVIDGLVVYALCSTSLETGAQVFRYDPSSGSRVPLFNLAEAAGEGGQRRVPQGKIHTPLYPYRGGILYTTHTDFYRIDGHRELIGEPPAGWLPFSGGGVFLWEPGARVARRLATAPDAEGILAAGFDPVRDRLFGITWPSGIFFRCDLATGGVRSWRGLAGDGELGTAERFYKLCRSIAVDPRDGAAFFTTSEGTIYRYDPREDDVMTAAREGLRKDYFGFLDPHDPGTMGYQWRQTVWSAADCLVYANHSESEYLFSFDPRTCRVRIVERLASRRVREGGMNRFGGSLGLAWAPDGRTLLYFAGSGEHRDLTIPASGGRTTQTVAFQSFNLVSWDTRQGRLVDHGTITFADGSRPYHLNSMAVAGDGTVYCLGFIVESGVPRTDLISIPLPEPLR